MKLNTNGFDWGSFVQCVLLSAALMFLFYLLSRYPV